MKLAVMQPYLFPYIGYFQLIYASDRFMLYDDVTYIKQGYINRNNILSKHGVTRFTVPVDGASSNKLICDTSYAKHSKKALNTIQQSYSKAPFFRSVFPIVQEILESDERSIATMCKKSLEDIFTYLEISKEVHKTSEIDYDRSGSAVDRIITLCGEFNADSYINSAGGRKLYHRSQFESRGLSLRFLEPISFKYPQRSKVFVPNLSIIDMLMNCSPHEVKEYLTYYELN
tara:strand:+ start:67 stop:756 length:690 start_codon:yes stop_codon:yes gene_type:complete